MTDEYQLDGTTWFEKNASAELLALLDVIEIGDTSTAPSTAGEIRLDGADVKVQSGGSTRNLSQVGTAQTSPGGSDTQVQYNSSGGFGGISDLTYDGTNLTSLTDIDTVLTLLNQGADPTTNGEIQNNGGDIKAYSGGAVRNLSDIGSGTTSPGGSDTQLQYNNAGSFGGISDLTYDGTNLTSLTSIDTTLTLLDQLADPSTNGEIQLNGSDIKAQSGGETKNLSNINSVAATGSTTLSSGSATVDTGVGSGTTATFMVALGPTTDDAQVAADIEAVSGGNYEVNIEETDTSVGNPSVEYDILRIR